MQANDALKQSLQQSMDSKDISNDQNKGGMAGGRKTMDVNSQMRGNLIGQMKVNRERMSVVPGMPTGNVPKALSDEVGCGDKPPLDLDQFGINSPKLPQSSQLSKA